MPPPRHRRTPSTPGRGRLAPALLCLLILAPGCALAQSPQPAQPSDGSTNSSSSDSNNNGNYFNPNFNPSMAIVIVVLITAFFFLGFSSIFIRNCAERDEEGSAGRGGGAGRAAGARSRRQQGLKPEVLESFPALVYSEVKEHKIGKGALECAVCLSEFEDDETLRLLPGCNHVFHVECIDAWLSSHVTCPVCRSNLVDAASQQPAGAGSSDVPANDAGREVPVAVPSPPPEHVAVVIDQADEEADEEQQQKEEAMELAELGSQQRESRTRSGRQPTKFPRSHSTGHSLAPRQPAAAAEPCECGDRYTLRLPDHVMKEIFAARKFHRSASCVAFPAEGEGSSRPGYRVGGEGSSRGGRSARGFGRSDRWPSFFVRTLSAKFPAWRRGGGGGGDGEGSVKKGNGEGSTTRGRFAAVMTPFECLNGGSGAAAASDGAKAEGAAASVEPESKSDALTRGV